MTELHAENAKLKRLYTETPLKLAASFRWRPTLSIVRGCIRCGRVQPTLPPASRDVTKRRSSVRR
jgi:hypothetical protein